MAVPTAEAFVYRWTNVKTNMMYVGVHKGTPDDGYVCSSKVLLNEYKHSPESFTRIILATGSLREMRELESSILQSVDAAKNPLYYNQHNNDGTFFCDGHSEKTRRKMSNSWKKRGKYNCDHEKAIAGWVGKTHTDDSKQRMRDAAKKHKEKRSNTMSLNNPMKNPDAIKRMLETRKMNKELRHGCAN